MDENSRKWVVIAFGLTGIILMFVGLFIFGGFWLIIPGVIFLILATWVGAGRDIPDIPLPDRLKTINIFQFTFGGLGAIFGFGDYQVDAWAAFVPARSELVKKLNEGVAKAVEKRGLENLTIETVEMGVGTRLQALFGEKREHQMYTQKLGGGSRASFALRIAKRGSTDLEISWRLFESNPYKRIASSIAQGFLLFLGIGWIIASAFLIPLLGVGLMVMPFGFIPILLAGAWWKANRGKTLITTYQQLDSRLLVQTVDYSLMKTLEDAGVSNHELRVLVATQTQGIGELGP